MEFDGWAPETAHASAFERKRPTRRRVERRAVVRVPGSFASSPERVFDAWLDPRIAGKWLFATASRPVARVAIDARAGGAFRFVERNDGRRVEHAGIYVDIVRPRRLLFTLADEKRSREATRVRVEITPLGKGCELTLEHENVPLDQAGRIEARWTGMLYGLGEILRAGLGTRI